VSRFARRAQMLIICRQAANR